MRTPCPSFDLRFFEYLTVILSKTISFPICVIILKLTLFNQHLIPAYASIVEIDAGAKICIAALPIPLRLVLVGENQLEVTQDGLKASINLLSKDANFGSFCKS